MFRGGVGVVAAVWRLEAEDRGDTGACLDQGTRAGALALRGVGLVFGEVEGKEGGTESRRGLAALRDRILGLVVGSLLEASGRECFLFVNFEGASPTLGSFATTGRENMDVFGCCGGRGLSPMKREAKLLHNESRSTAIVERGVKEAAGARSHSTEENPEAGRSGGG